MIKRKKAKIHFLSQFLCKQKAKFKIRKDDKAIFKRYFEEILKLLYSIALAIALKIREFLIKDKSIDN
jgi:hypothetical protein